MKLWLDDIRPAPEGWLLVKTVSQAQDAIQKALRSPEGFEEASLDHDLGTCDECVAASTIVLVQTINCAHNGTGYDLVTWMAQYGLWPKVKPLVHSWNPSGKKAMEAMIERHFDGETR